MFFAANPKDTQSRAMYKLELPVINLEIRLLTLIFAGFYCKVGAAVAVIARPATGVWATVFWIGVVGIGLVSAFSGPGCFCCVLQFLRSYCSSTFYPLCRAEVYHIIFCFFKVKYTKG